MEKLVWEIIAYVATTLLGIFFTWLKATQKARKQQQQKLGKDFDIMRETCKYALFSLLKESYNHYVKDLKYCNIENKKEIEEMYRLYHDGLKGNGMGTKMYETIMDLPNDPSTI